MSKSRAKSESNIYHVMARGDGRQIVFENDEDRKLFLALLRNRKQQDAPIFCLVPYGQPLPSRHPGFPTCIVANDATNHVSVRELVQYAAPTHWTRLQPTI